jgi:hypothetical protein
MFPQCPWTIVSLIFFWEMVQDLNPYIYASTFTALVPLEELETIDAITIITIGTSTRSTAMLTGLAIRTGSLAAQKHAGDQAIFSSTALMEGICGA